MLLVAVVAPRLLERGVVETEDFKGWEREGVLRRLLSTCLKSWESKDQFDFEGEQVCCNETPEIPKPTPAESCCSDRVASKTSDGRSDDDFWLAISGLIIGGRIGGKFCDLKEGLFSRALILGRWISSLLRELCR